MIGVDVAAVLVFNYCDFERLSLWRDSSCKRLLWRYYQPHLWKNWALSNGTPSRVRIVALVQSLHWSVHLAYSAFFVRVPQCGIL